MGFTSNGDPKPTVNPFPKQIPNVEFSAKIVPSDPPYAKGESPGGILWETDAKYVRLKIVNGSTPIKELDFTVTLDSGRMIREIAQITNVPNRSWSAVDTVGGSPPEAFLSDDKGNDERIFGGVVNISSTFHIHCATLFANSDLEFIIKAEPMVLLSPKPGKPPLEERPLSITVVTGTYETSNIDGGQRYRFGYSLSV
jgi:hypothetical protein